MADIGAKIYELIAGVLLIVFGLALYPTVQSAVDTAIVNATGLAATLMPLIPAIYAIVIIVLGVSMIAIAAKNKK